MKDKTALVGFNKGIVDSSALARLDIDRIALAAEEQTNWMPRLLGPMSLRPGLERLGTTDNHDVTRMISFVFSLTETAMLELTANGMRVWENGVDLVTRPAVSSAIADPNFTDNTLASWTDNDQGAATSTWLAGNYLSLLGSGASEARRTQLVAVAGGDQNVEHALDIHVERGLAIVRIGSTSGGSEYNEVLLRPGWHSIVFTPAGNFYVQLASDTPAPTLVASCSVATAGPMSVPTPWVEEDLPKLREFQSLDVVFVAWGGHPYRIERQDARSWSVTKYLATGPFLGENTGPITITPSAASGAITLTASSALFLPGHVGAQFRLETSGQEVSKTINFGEEPSFSDPIRVTGIQPNRTFAITVTGTFVATVTLQRSLGAPGDWVDVATYTTPTTTTLDDGLNNQEVYYRIGVDSGDFTSGTVVVALVFASGATTGIARVTKYNSSVSVDADVEEDFGTVEATATWWEGAWSDVNGWPTSVAVFGGRLWWSGSDRLDGSESDNYTGYDETTVEGDSAPILRTIGSGPSATINWLLALPQLLVGAQLSVKVAKSSSLDEPLTPTAFDLKNVSSVGSAAVAAEIVDRTGVYVARDSTRVHELAREAAGDYESRDLTLLAPKIGGGGVSRLAVARFPDTRIFCVRADGKLAVLVYDRAESVSGWVLFETDGVVEDIITLPRSPGEDLVLAVVRRTINGSTVRNIERFAKEEETTGAAATKLADALITYSGASVTTVPGLSSLEGKTVVVWGNGKDLGSYVVSGGQITLTEAVTTCYVGLPYTARYKSARWALASAAGVPLNQRKILNQLALALADTHARGLRVGQDFDNLNDLPTTELEAVVGADDIHAIYSADSFLVDGTWDNDARLCMEAASPRPVTVLAAILTVVGHDK